MNAIAGAGATMVASADVIRLPGALGMEAFRDAIAEVADYCIGLLDMLDGDPDLEAEIDHGADDAGEPDGATFLAPPISFAPLYARAGGR